MATKLSQNQHYGRPSPRKIKERNEGWKNWASLMKMLKDIREEPEMKPKLEAIWAAYN